MVVKVLEVNLETFCEQSFACEWLWSNIPIFWYSHLRWVRDRWSKMNKGDLAHQRCSKVPAQTVISCSMKPDADTTREMLGQTITLLLSLWAWLAQTCTTIALPTSPKHPRARPTPEEPGSSLYALSHLLASWGCLSYPRAFQKALAVCVQVADSCPLHLPILRHDICH